MEKLNLSYAYLNVRMEENGEGFYIIKILQETEKQGEVWVTMPAEQFLDIAKRIENGMD